MRKGEYTQHVLENYQVSRQKVPVEFLRNYIRVKKVYAEVNQEAGKLNAKKAASIQKACKGLLDLSDQKLEKELSVDVIQSGGGTSTNMVVNEAIAIPAKVHPNDDVNMSQSSNDTFPGVTKITTAQQFVRLLEELKLLEKAFAAKSKKFRRVKKVGRTHLQDALVISFGDEFSAYAQTIKKNRIFLTKIQKFCLTLPFGATAVGSLQNITPKIRTIAIKKLSKEFGIKFKKPDNYFETTSSSGDFQKIASALSSLAGDLIKISSDLRLLASGPRAGLAEIDLPSVQAGSSIMPGKVNPSIVEALMMACFRVKGLSLTIDLAVVHAQLELQAFGPSVSFSLCEAMNLLTNGLDMFRTKCLEGLSVNEKQAQRLLDNSFVYATEYSERLGYTRVAELVKKSLNENLNLKDLLEKELKNERRS